ncbi:MAG: GHMP kinase [Sphingobacteriales bacterium]|nr:GHMP kinase [Sphingobacteriales bacterium]
MKSGITGHNRSFSSHGKLLLTGEYLVLHGADAFAIPLKKGQRLIISESQSDESILQWESLEGEVKWFSASFSTTDFSIIQTNSFQIAKRLSGILTAARELNPSFLTNSNKTEAQSILEFNREWGLGSSSTLISNISFWADINPFQLLDMTFGGSGYDVACARSSSALIYNLNKRNSIKYIDFKPDFRNHLTIAYLGHKQNTAREIKNISVKPPDKKQLSQISDISRKIALSKSLDYFISCLKENDSIVSSYLQRPTLHAAEFSDFIGYIKNMGAWGGDFILAASPESQDYVNHYLDAKGIGVRFSYDELALSPTS